MEVFRYWTRSKLDRARNKGRVESFQPKFRYPHYVFVLPCDSMLWGEKRMHLLASQVRSFHRSSREDGLVLFSFDIQPNDPDIYIRDLDGTDFRAWYPLANHPVETFERPEIIVPTPIEIERITELPLPEELRAWGKFTPYGMPQLQTTQP